MDSPTTDVTPKASISRVTSKEVAVAAGVHQSTVSRALRGDPGVADSTRSMIKELAQALGYVPNRSARTLREQGSRVVGVMVDNLDNPFYHLLLAHIHRGVSEAGYSTVLLVDPLHRRADFSRLERLLDSSLDGLVVSTAALDSDTPARLVQQGIPIVLAVRSVPGLDVDIVEPDNRAAGREAARHLVELGHESIAVIMGPAVVSTSADRLRGVLEVAGDAIDPQNIVHGQYSHDSGQSLLQRVMQRESPPSAIIAGNDIIAIGVLDAARRSGIGVPADLSIIGFDDIPMSSWHSFRLTTVHQDVQGMAAQAARCLIERIQNPDHRPAHYRYPASLTVRGTTAPPRSAHTPR
ncbi:MAG: LacI family transcriptional regulator [Acidimicrobiia bacterium]|nr:LacI family transcriptional regulator [Acidimicrobiia bacterium]